MSKDVERLAKCAESEDVNVAKFADLDPDGRFVLFTRIRSARIVTEDPRQRWLSRQEFTDFERKVCVALESMIDPDMKGRYWPLTKLEEEIRNQNVCDIPIRTERNRFVRRAQASTYWLDGRGCFRNNSETFIAGMDSESQVRLVSIQKGGDVDAVLKRLIKGVDGISAGASSFSDPQFIGWTNAFCLSNLVTDVRASVQLRLPKLSMKKEQFQDVHRQFKVHVRGLGARGGGWGSVYDVSNHDRRGISEHDATFQMYTAVKFIIDMEKAA